MEENTLGESIFENGIADLDLSLLIKKSEDNPDATAAVDSLLKTETTKENQETTAETTEATETAETTETTTEETTEAATEETATEKTTETTEEATAETTETTETEESTKSTETEETTTEETKTEETTEAPYKAVADLLHFSGSIGSVPEDFDNTSDGLHKLFEDEVEARVQGFIDNLPETAKYLINSYKEGTPLKDLIQHEAIIQNYEGITSDNLENNEELQKQVMRDYHSRVGLSEQEISEEINEAVEAETLGAKSKRHLSKLIQFEKNDRDTLLTTKKEESKDKERRYEKQVDNLKTTLRETTEIIPGVKLNEGDRRTIFNGITKFDRNGKNEYMKFRDANPNFDILASYLALVLKGDLSKLDKAAITKATRKIKNSLGKTTKEKTTPAIDASVIKSVMADPTF